MAKIFRTTFEYKAGFLDPIDWRPREFNTAADYAANCTPHSGGNVDSITDDDKIGDSLKDATAVQVFSDGGFNKGVGVAAFVVTAVRFDGKSFSSEQLGARGLLISGDCSALHAEVAALDASVEYLLRLARICKRQA